MFDVLHQLEGLIGLTFKQILPCLLDFQHAVFGMLLQGKVDSSSREAQLVLFHVVVDDILKLRAVEIGRFVGLQHLLIALDGRFSVFFFVEIILKIFVVKHCCQIIWVQK